MIQIIVKAVDGNKNVAKVTQAIEAALDKVVPMLGEDVIMDELAVNLEDALRWEFSVLTQSAQERTDKYLQSDGSYQVEKTSVPVKES